MAVSPDDRFAGLISASAERGGWVPGDVFAADAHGEEEPVATRRVRLPILVALGVLTAAILVAAFLLFRPAAEHSAAGQPAGQVPAGPSAAAGAGSASPKAAASGEIAASGETAAAAGAGTVTVHVTGQVRHPGVVTLDAGSRVQDAVEAVGGLSNDAAAESVNLARVLVDGEQIHIPRPGEPAGGDPGESGRTGGAGADGSGAASGSGSPGAAGSGAGGSGTTAADAGPKVDLNTADSTTLQTLPGIGPVTAEAIIAHRQTQPFSSVEDLLLVHGIGPKTYERLKDHVTVG